MLHPVKSLGGLTRRPDMGGITEYRYIDMNNTHLCCIGSVVLLTQVNKLVLGMSRREIDIGD